MLDIFSEARWDEIEATYEKWWTRALERPVLNLSFTGANSDLPRPEGIVTGDLFRYPAEESAERIAEKLEYLQRSQRYEYDGYPYIFMYFGPVYDVEFFGAKAHAHDTTVWYKADEVPPAEKMHMRIDPESVFLPRYQAIAKACEERFGGGYVISSPPAGGHCLDGIAEFYKPMDLSYMLFDEPDEVNRLSMEYHQASKAMAKELIALTPSARGYTSWGGLYAPIPWIGMQSDFCAMIGRDHFERFVKWDLELAVSESPRYNYYHLDGPGELIHLDSILDMKDLKCVQWVAGPGDRQEDKWPEVYQKISSAEKNMWVMGPIEHVEAIAEQIGTTKGLYWAGSYPMTEYDRVMTIADRLIAGR